MKAADINEAYRISQKIGALEGQRAMVAAGGNELGVTIRGTYQDPSFVDAIRPSVLQELDRRIEEQMGALSELGVTFP